MKQLLWTSSLLLVGCATTLAPPAATAPRRAPATPMQEPAPQAGPSPGTESETASPSLAAPAPTTASPQPAATPLGGPAGGATLSVQTLHIIDRMKEDGTMLYCAPDANPPCVRMKPPLLDKVEQYESWVRDLENKRSLQTLNAKAR